MHRHCTEVLIKKRATEKLPVALATDHIPRCGTPSIHTCYLCCHFFSLFQI